MTAIEAERTVLRGLLLVTRGLRLSGSAKVAEQAAKREQAFADELKRLGATPADELHLEDEIDPAERPLALAASQQEAKQP